MSPDGSAAGGPPADDHDHHSRKLVVHESLRRKHKGALDGVVARLLRSAGSRFAVIYAGLFATSALALAVFLWWSTAGLLDRQTDSAIDADTRGLAAQYLTGGTPAVARTIEQRLAGNVDDDALYLLVDPEFHWVAGNLDHWPASVAMDEAWKEVAISHAGLRGIARVHHFELEGGYHLLVGRDVESRLQMRRLLADALLWAAAIAVALGMFGAWAVRRIFAMTLADISETAAAISAGDFRRRVRKIGNGDEFDRLADTINDMLDRIHRLMDGVRQVSNAIAHDLRTPIARARTRLEEAALHAASEAELRAAVERAEADLDGLTAIFEALLRIAEIEAGSRRSAFADCDLAPLLFDITDLYIPVAEERGIEIVSKIPEHVAFQCDRNMIQQAIANLLDNAIKFSPPDGQVSIEVETEPSFVRIVVGDHGPGIPEAERERATERFYRGEQARSTPGSGLGLALVQAVATLHNGSLSLHDNDPGLRAVITLSRAVSAHVAEEQQPAT